MKKILSLAISITVILAAFCVSFGDAGGPTLPELEVYVSNPDGAVLMPYYGEDGDQSFLVPYGTKLTLEGMRLDSDFAPVAGSETSPLEDGFCSWKVKYSDISPFEPEESPEGPISEEFYAVLTGEDVAVFKGPDDNLYEQCGVFPAGAVIEGTCYDSDLWAYAEYDGVRGWAPIGPMAVYFDGPIDYYAKDSGDLNCIAFVNDGGCRVRGVSSGGISASLLEGDEVTILKEEVAVTGNGPESASLQIMYDLDGKKYTGLVDSSSVTPCEKKVTEVPENADWPFSYYFGIDYLSGPYKILVESPKGTALYGGPGYFYGKTAALEQGDELVLMNIANIRDAFWMYVDFEGVRGWLPSEDKSEPANTFAQTPRTWAIPLKEKIDLRCNDTVSVYDKMLGGEVIGELAARETASCEKMAFPDSYFPVYYVSYSGGEGWLDANNTWAEFDGIDGYYRLGDIFIDQEPAEEIVLPETPAETEEAAEEKPEEKAEEPKNEDNASENTGKDQQKPEKTGKTEEKPAEEPENKAEKKTPLKTVILICALAAAVISATALVTIRLVSCKKKD